MLDSSEYPDLAHEACWRASRSQRATLAWRLLSACSGAQGELAGVSIAAGYASMEIAERLFWRAGRAGGRLDRNRLRDDRAHDRRAPHLPARWLECTCTPERLIWRAQGVLADVSIATGYATIALMIAGRLIFQRAGWAAAAFITPSVLLLFGGAFFAFSLSSAPGAAGWAVLAGAVTQVRLL